MMKGRAASEWLMPGIVAIIAASFCFFWGQLLMDYGATFKGTAAYGQSLVFERIEPRIMYHGGLMMTTGSFMVVCALCVSALVRKCGM